MATYPELVSPEKTERESIACFVYADSGRKKSTFAASFPKPILVLGCDPHAKLTPYRRQGRRGRTLLAAPGTPWIVDTEFVMSRDDEDSAIIQLEHYFDEDVTNPNQVFAWELLQQRLVSLHAEIRANLWATVVLDSLSQLEYMIRKYNQYKANPVTEKGNEQDQRQWYRKSAEGMEEVLFSLARAKCNFVALAHVRAEKDRARDAMIWTPEAPGSRNRKLPTVFSEIYTIHARDDVDPMEDEAFYLQTRGNRDWIATTMIMAPNGAPPDYGALWDNYKGVD